MTPPQPAISAQNQEAAMTPKETDKKWVLGTKTTVTILILVLVIAMIGIMGCTQLQSRNNTPGSHKNMSVVLFSVPNWTGVWCETLVGYDNESQPGGMMRCNKPVMGGNGAGIGNWYDNETVALDRLNQQSERWARMGAPGGSGAGSCNNCTSEPKEQP